LNLEELINSCGKGNTASQSVLYQTYKDTLFAVSLKYCKNREEAQDNLQDAFLEIFKRIKRFKHVGSFEGWMKRITINKAIDKYKKNVKSKDLNYHSLTEEEVATAPIDQIPLTTILKFIQNLPDQYRLVFNLYELDDFSHREISKLLAISEGTSKSNLNRAKKILKQNINEYHKQVHEE